MSAISTKALESLSARLDFAEQMSRRRYERPDEWYIPSYPGMVRNDGGHCTEWANQLGFHQSTHAIRALCPGTGYGKALKHGETVLTPHGWVRIETIQVGDEVIGSNGKPTTVLGVYPQGVRQMIRVEFNDGSALTVDRDHLWTVQLRDNRYKRPGFPERFGQWQTIQTQEIIDRFGSVPNPTSRPTIPSVKPVEFASQTVPMDPYILGLLLGDGNMSNRAGVRFSTADEELITQIRRCFRVSYLSRYDYTVHDAGRWLAMLSLLKKRSEHKFVPDIYLWNDVATRRAVLAGLLDTDGSAMENKHEFCSTSERLANDVVFLVRSLGGKATKSAPRITSCTHKGEKRAGRPSWRVHYWLDECPYRLARKVARWRTIETNPGRIMRRLVEDDEAEATCIRVAAPDGLFVASDFIVTHNTAAGAAEVNAWVTHSNRWQRTPAWPIQALWVAKDKPQFEKLRPQLEHESFSRPWVWRESSGCYEWPGGDRMFVFSAEKDWTSIGGINPDLILCDEEPPKALWHELMFRRRGRRDTRFCIMATAVEGITWMHDEVYKPWLDFHALKGLDEERAMKTQLHRDIWVWSRGGIDDNPVATAEQRRWYREMATSAMSDNEKHVRMHGGFRSWVGDPVFNEAAMDALEKLAAEAEKKWGKGKTGSLAVVDKEKRAA